MSGHRSQAAGTGVLYAPAAPLTASLEAFEPRLLLSAAYPNNYDQYMLELVNRARSDPAAEAARLGIDLNEGITSEFITAGAKQPLAFSPYLVDSARTHSEWMLANDVFDHTGAGGSGPGDRMVAAGYGAAGTFGWGENIAWKGTTPGVPNIQQYTRNEYDDLFTDFDVDERGHRKNICDPDFSEAGVGVAAGPFTYMGTTYNTVMATQDFGYKLAGSFLTGVAYDESLVTGDEAEGIFYHPGEGLAGVTVTATRNSDSAVFTTTTWSSGGYTLALPAGTYTVTGSGAPLGGVVTYGNVVIAGQNVKRDFNPSTAPLALTSPATPQVVQRGTGYALQWTGGQTSTTLNLLRLGSTGWATLATGLSAAAGSYTWDTTGAAYGWHAFVAKVNDGGVWVAEPPASPSWLRVAQTVPPPAPSGVLTAGEHLAASGPAPYAPGHSNVTAADAQTCEHAAADLPELPSPGVYAIAGLVQADDAASPAADGDRTDASLLEALRQRDDADGRSAWLDSPLLVSPLVDLLGAP